jgi:iron complex transport system ATP-binding protein
VTPLLEFRRVTAQRDQCRVLEDVSFSIAFGEHVAIVGPNGSGKSTLIKLITRELYPRRVPGASLKILGDDDWNVFDLRVLLGIVTPDLIAACTRDFTAREVVLSGFFSSIGTWPHQTITPAMEQKAAEVLHTLEIPHLADRVVEEMSSGEARRVVIGRALVHDPRALILDEPTTSLDLRAMRELRAILQKLAQAGISIILVTHHLEDIMPEIGRVILLRAGRILADGPKDEVLTSQRLSELFETEVEVSRRNGYYYAR